MNKKRNGGGFVKIPWNIVQRTTDAELKTLAVLTHYCSLPGGGFPSIETIAREAGKQRRAIITALDNLSAKGFIQKHSRPGLTTVYNLPGVENSTTETDLDQCKKMHRGCAENCTHNKIAFNKNETETLLHERARTRAVKTKKTPYFGFEIKNPLYRDDPYAFPFLDDVPDKVYRQALKIGYSMSITELYRFCGELANGHTPKGDIITDPAGYLEVWKNNQVPGMARQAKNERRTLKQGGCIQFKFQDRTFVRLKPIPYTGEEQRHKVSSIVEIF